MPWVLFLAFVPFLLAFLLTGRPGGQRHRKREEERGRERNREEERGREGKREEEREREREREGERGREREREEQRGRAREREEERGREKEGGWAGIQTYSARVYVWWGGVPKGVTGTMMRG